MSVAFLEKETEYLTQVPNVTYKRGDIFLADLNGNMGSQQIGIKPVLVLQNDVGNRFSPNVIVCILTSKVKKEMPTHVKLNAIEHGLRQESYVLLEQLYTLDKLCLMEKLTHINEQTMRQVDKALRVSVGLYN